MAKSNRIKRFKRKKAEHKKAIMQFIKLLLTACVGGAIMAIFTYTTYIICAICA